MIGPAVRRLVADLEAANGRSEYEDALLAELGPLVSATAPALVEAGRQDEPPEGFADMRVVVVSYEPLGPRGRNVVAEMLIGGGGPRGGMGQKDIVRLHCDKPGCPNKRL